MKKLHLYSEHFQYVEEGFAQWLETKRYSKSTVYNMPNHVRAYLHWTEGKGDRELKAITAESIRQYYYTYLRNRLNQRRGGGLSSAHLNKNIQALNLFTNYLRQSGKLIIAALKIKTEEQEEKNISVLSQEEVKQFYEVCDKHPAIKRKPDWFYPAIAKRDKAMLAIFYGCGLRRNEAEHLDVADIVWEKEHLHVRQGKNYKERFVPISKQSLKYLEQYIYDCRKYFLPNKKEDALFLCERKRRMTGQAMYIRIKTLQKRDENLKEKEIGLHKFRHSIASHLLCKGMNIERIKDFLGHSSLESTQIYTHL